MRDVTEVIHDLGCNKDETGAKAMQMQLGRGAQIQGVEFKVKTAAVPSLWPTLPSVWDLQCPCCRYRLMGRRPRADEDGWNFGLAFVLLLPLALSPPTLLALLLFRFMPKRCRIPEAFSELRNNRRSWGL